MPQVRWWVTEWEAANGDQTVDWPAVRQEYVEKMLYCGCWWSEASTSLSSLITSSVLRAVVMFAVTTRSHSHPWWYMMSGRLQFSTVCPNVSLLFLAGWLLKASSSPDFFLSSRSFLRVVHAQQYRMQPVMFLNACGNLSATVCAARSSWSFLGVGHMSRTWSMAYIFTFE